MNLLNKFIQRICSISRYGRSSAAGTKWRGESFKKNDSPKWQSSASVWQLWVS